MGFSLKRLPQRTRKSQSPFEFIFLTCTSANNINQPIFIHLMGEQIGSRLFDIQQLLQFRTNMITSGSITDAVCDTGIGFIHIIDSGQVSLIVNSDYFQFTLYSLLV